MTPGCAGGWAAGCGALEGLGRRTTNVWRPSLLAAPPANTAAGLVTALRTIVLDGPPWRSKLHAEPTVCVSLDADPGRPQPVLIGEAAFQHDGVVCCGPAGLFGLRPTGPQGQGGGDGEEKAAKQSPRREPESGFAG